jgi:hypothetical protein
MTHVDWHPYPETHPTENGWFLVTYKNFALNPDWSGDERDFEPKFSDNFTLEVMEREFFIDEKTGDFAFDYDKLDGNEVIAWGEMPEPYRPEVKNEIHE